MQESCFCGTKDNKVFFVRMGSSVGKSQLSGQEGSCRTCGDPPAPGSNEGGFLRRGCVELHSGLLRNCAILMSKHGIKTILDF